MTDELRNAITLSVMERWKKDRFERTIMELSQFDNKKPEKLETEFDHFDVDNSYPTSPLIVDLDFVYKQLLDGQIHIILNAISKIKIDRSYKHFIP